METEQMAEVWGAPGTRPSDRENSKAARKQAKADKKRAEHERAQRGAVTTPAQRVVASFRREDLTPAQVQMQLDMEAGVHKKINPADFRPDPVKLRDVLDDLADFPSDSDVSRMAHVLIEEHGADLRLGLREFGIIQRIVEAAVRVDPADL